MRKFFAFPVLIVLAGAVYFLFPQAVSVTDKPVPEPMEETLPETSVFTYIINSGDSINLIARRFGISAETILNANITKNGVIYKGDTLGIPLKRSKLVSLHTVVKGETISSIAEDYGTNVESIMKLNHMRDDTILESDKILVHRSAGHNSRFVVLMVGHGDTMAEISRAFGVRKQEIERFNVSNPDWHEPGSLIVVDTFNYSYPEQIRKRILETAEMYMGSPYKYGGNSTETGIDCSAYVKKVFSFFGVNLPRTVRMMHRHAEGRWVRKNRLEKGDLVFFETDRPFPSHIGIYMENGNFIHASSVRGRVTVSNLGESYYKKTYIGAKRIYLRDSFASMDTNTAH